MLTRSYKSKKPIRAYLASPYSPRNWFERLPLVSNLIRYFRYRSVTKIAAKLTENYNVALICPITQSHNIAKFMNNPDTGFKSWKNIDFAFIDSVDEVWVYEMNGWNKSEGVRAEIKYAKKLNKPVRYIDINYK